MPPKTRSRRARSVTRRAGAHLLSKCTALIFIALLAYVWTRFTMIPADIGSADPTLPFWHTYWLRARLLSKSDILTAVRGTTATNKDFIVHQGESATDVSLRLAQRNIVPDAKLLRDYLVYKGLDSQVEAGYFQFEAGMTTIDVAKALTGALPQEVPFHMWAGWRFEEAGHALSRHPHLSVNPLAFQSLANRTLPPPNNYSFIQSLPASSTLEGYLLPGDYVFSPRSTAPQVIDKMLGAFDSRANRYRRLANQQNLSLHEFVILASIVQRETIDDSEAPLIAKVFLNRIALGMPLGADPTAQYPLGTSANWWPHLSVDPRQIQHPYNTYIISGLPPGPIANPSKHSLESVGAPAHSDYLYFRAACNNSGLHNFSHTYQEHLLWGCSAQ